MFVNSPLFSEQGSPEQEENSILDIDFVFCWISKMFLSLYLLHLNTMHGSLQWYICTYIPVNLGKTASTGSSNTPINYFMFALKWPGQCLCHIYQIIRGPSWSYSQKVIRRKGLCLFGHEKDSRNTKNYIYINYVEIIMIICNMNEK